MRSKISLGPVSHVPNVDKPVVFPSRRGVIWWERGGAGVTLEEIRTAVKKSVVAAVQKRTRPDMNGATL